MDATELRPGKGWQRWGMMVGAMLMFGLSVLGGGVVLLACLVSWLTASGLPAAVGLASGSLLMGLGVVGLAIFLCWWMRRLGVSDAG